MIRVYPDSLKQYETTVDFHRGFLLPFQRRGCACVTEKQKRFVNEYLIDLNATQAAIRAGYSPKTAQEQSSRLLSNVMVQNELAQRMAEQSRRTGINADRVLRELAAMGFADTNDIVRLRMKGADRVKALELLGKHLGLFTDKVQLEVDSSAKLEDVFRQIGGKGLSEDD